jgi:hypothetical protein
VSIDVTIKCYGLATHVNVKGLQKQIAEDWLPVDVKLTPEYMEELETALKQG